MAGPHRRGGGPPRRSVTRLADSDAVELRDVVVQEPILLLLSESGGMLLQQLLRIWPGRVPMREVIGPHQALRIAHVLHLEGDPVVLESRVDLLAKILARHLR